MWLLVQHSLKYEAVVNMMGMSECKQSCSFSQAAVPKTHTHTLKPQLLRKRPN